jgi:hypothetical protein
MSTIGFGRSEPPEQDALGRAALENAARGFQMVHDQILQLSPGSGLWERFKAAVVRMRCDPHKVLVDAHTKRLFSAATPTVLRAVRETNTLFVDCGRANGVIAGVVIRLASKTTTYRELYAVQDKDLHDDHLCIHPAALNLEQTDESDLILSFVPRKDLNSYERALSSILDIAAIGREECRAVLQQLE